jgi:hypothetical protein
MLLVIIHAGYKFQTTKVILYGMPSIDYFECPPLWQMRTLDRDRASDTRFVEESKMRIGCCMQ